MKGFRLFIIFIVILGCIDLLSVQELSLADVYKTGKINLVECLSLDSDNLPSDTVLRYITDFIVTRNGHIFICDSQQNHLLIFDQTGKFIKMVGQQGKGPGDLNGPVCLTTDGVKVLVYENSNGRTSEFDLEGSFIKVYNSKPFSRMDRMKFLPSGKLIIQTTKQNSGQNAGQEKILYLLSHDFSTETILYQQQVFEEKWITQPIRIYVPQPFQPLVSWDVSQNGSIFIGFQGRYTIEVHDSRKGRISEFNHLYTPVRTTDEDRNDFFAGFVIATNNDVIRKIPDYIVDNAVMPAVKPAFYEIITDYQGNVLVFPSLPHGAENVVFDAFTPEGKFIQTVKVSKDLLNPHSLRFTDGSLWTSLLNEEDEPILKRYKIE